MDIGDEEDRFIVEPVHAPLPEREPEREPAPTPAPTPLPEGDPVPA